MFLNWNQINQERIKFSKLGNFFENWLPLSTNPIFFQKFINFSESSELGGEYVIGKRGERFENPY